MTQPQTQGWISKNGDEPKSAGQALYGPFYGLTVRPFDLTSDPIHLLSGGVPRIIKAVCDNSLITGFAEQVKPIPARIVEEVGREFDLGQVPSRRGDGQRQVSQILALAPASDTERGEDAETGGGRSRLASLMHQRSARTRENGGSPRFGTDRFSTFERFRDESLKDRQITANVKHEVNAGPQRI